MILNKSNDIKHSSVEHKTKIHIFLQSVMLNADQNIIKYINISMSKFNQHNKKENIKDNDSKTQKYLNYYRTLTQF